MEFGSGTARVGRRNQNELLHVLCAFDALTQRASAAIQDSEFKNTERKRFPARIFACREEIRR
jgi:hypothetical protein